MPSMAPTPTAQPNPPPPPPASASSPAWLAVGRMVNVARRMGPGMNSPGGLGHVVRVYSVRTAPDGTAAAADAASGGDRRGRRGGAGEGGAITYTVDCVDARPARTSRSVDRPLWFRFIADIVAGLSATKAAIKKPLSKIKNHLEIQSENEMYFQVVSLFR